MRNNITQANTIRAYNLIAGNVAHIESMETYAEISKYLTDKLETEFSVHNARSIIASVMESGVKMDLRAARKNSEPAKELQLEDIAELIKSLSAEVVRLAELYESMVGSVTSFEDRIKSHVDNYNQRNTEPKDPAGLGTMFD